MESKISAAMMVGRMTGAGSDIIRGNLWTVAVAERKSTMMTTKHL